MSAVDLSPTLKLQSLLEQLSAPGLNLVQATTLRGEVQTLLSQLVREETMPRTSVNPTHTGEAHKARYDHAPESVVASARMMSPVPMVS